MKREAIGHTKMKRLCRRLGIRGWQAVGIMESLWHLTAREAPRGDIGKLSDEDIALGIDWEGDPTPLIEALVSSGWVDQDDADRLAVHDWHEHADDAVQTKLARSKQYFVGGFIPKLTKLGREERTEAQEYYRSTPYVRTTCAQNTPDVQSWPPTRALALPEPVPEPVPASVRSSIPAIKGGLPMGHAQPDLWDEFWGFFVKAGKGLNDKDQENALKLWINFGVDVHLRIIAWCKAQFSEKWTEERYTPMPAKVLRDEGWTRKVVEKEKSKPAPIDYSKVIPYDPFRARSAEEIEYERQCAETASMLEADYKASQLAKKTKTQ